VSGFVGASPVATHSLVFHQQIVGLMCSPLFDDFFAQVIAQLRLMFCAAPDEQRFQSPWLERDLEIHTLLANNNKLAAGEAMSLYLDDSERQSLALFTFPLSRIRTMYKDYPAAYQVSKGSALQVDTAFYERIRERKDQRTLVEQFEVPIRTGRAWKVPAGHVFRVTTPVGPQVGDFNVWNANDPRERLWAARTRQLQGAHVSTHDRLWSNLPFLRPLVTITDDSLASYGIDEHGGRLHDLLGTRCDPYVNRMLTGEDFHHHCHSNLTRAVLPHGLTEFDVHDVLNIFQCTGLNHDDMYFMKACPAQKGDYLEFFAEIDLLCALSTCPGGDLSLPMWGPDAQDPLTVCRPLGVEIYRLEAELLNGWNQPERAAYKGQHGLQIAKAEWE